jgi:hypothetical protein
MTLLDTVKGILPLGKPPTAEIPPSVSTRLRRGRAGMMRDASKRRLCVRFEEGDTYWFLDSRGGLNSQSTVTNPNGSGKPPHRVRNKYNFIKPIVTAKVSAATQRIPGFEVVPTSTDPQRVGAARLSEKISLAGYDKWRLHAVDVDATLNAIGHGGEAFALPYFDPNVGPYHEVQDDQTGEPTTVGEGELKVIVLNGNQAYWEDGCDFMESRWHVVERARVIEDVEEMTGFFGPCLTPDAATSDIPTDSKPDNMVMVTEYFERPCPKYPEGRHLVIANGRQVVPEQQYPLRNRDGVVIDEPVLHRLAWDLGGGARRQLGLTWQLIDAQRTAQDSRNKAVEWKNRCLMPQMIAQAGSMPLQRDDVPGTVMYYQGQNAPVWEDVKPIPDSLFRLADVAKEDMREIGFATQIEAAPDVAAKSIQAAVEQSDLQWAQFLIGKADWWSRLMRHCLVLVARHYTEERLLAFRGRDGWEHVQDFEGAQLMDEVDVRVNPSSLVTLTRAQVRDMLQWIATTFPGWLNPQDALVALQTGSLDRLVVSFWLDMSRVNTVIEKIRDGTVMDMPTRGSTDPVTKQPIVDPQTGQPMPYPGYMPDEQDDLKVWERVWSDWMKTDDYAQQPPANQEIARQVWDGIQALKNAKAMQDAQMQTAMAEQQGLSNATRGPQPKPLPSQPAPQQ